MKKLMFLPDIRNAGGFAWNRMSDIFASVFCTFAGRKTCVINHHGGHFFQWSYSSFPASTDTNQSDPCICQSTSGRGMLGESLLKGHSTHSTTIEQKAIRKMGDYSMEKKYLGKGQVGIPDFPCTVQTQLY